MKLLLKIFELYFNTLSIFSVKASAKQAFHLFAFPFKAKLTENHQKFLNTSEKFDIDVDGKIIQGYKWGHGTESILFVHGWQSNTYRWKSIIEAFDQNKYTLYSFDAPGHGNSGGRICTVPLFEKTIEALIEKKGAMNHIIGHSIGSFSCAAFMFHKEYKPMSYVSLASPYSASEFINDFKNRLKLSPKTFKFLLEYFENYVGHPISHYNHQTFCLSINPEHTLIIHDKMDRATSYENSVKMHQHLLLAGRSVELVLTDGYRHNLRSGEVVKMVVKFVERESVRMKA